MKRKSSIPVHVGDELYLGNKMVVVLLVNRSVTPHRVLVGNRKHRKAMYPAVRMVNDCDLAYRPDKLLGKDRELNSLKKLQAANGGNDLIDWEPGIGKKPGEPTDAIAGSAEKVEVLARRMAAGLSLWHPGDATYEDLGRLIESGEISNDGIIRKIAHIVEYVPKEFRVSKNGKTSGLKTDRRDNL